jgi:hypothetical protein
MIFTGLLGLLSALLAGSEAPAAPAQRVKVMAVEERLTIRVPVAPRPRLKIRWEEEKGPKCLPAAGIAAAFYSGPESVDFLMRSRQMIRARFDSDCEGLDYYGGFYLQTEDRRICARRDTIRSRTGGSCRILKFRPLVPQIER